MFPAEALARALLARGEAVSLITDRRGRAFGNALPDVPVHRVRAGTPSGGAWRKIRGVTSLLLGYRQARGILRGDGARIVVGFGGYASVPAVFAASRLRIPLVLHEQNAVLGRANRLFQSRADIVATAYPIVRRCAEGVPTFLTGNPVRPEIAALGADGYRAPDPDQPMHILVTGGSQGARVFSSLVPEAVAGLPDRVRNRLVITQQCRREDLEQAQGRYAELGVRATLSDFFTDMPAQLSAAHLVIARAGASTCAEVTAVGRPAVLVPYPYAADDHQTANARALEEAGAAWLRHQDRSWTRTASAVC